MCCEEWPVRGQYSITHKAFGSHYESDLSSERSSGNGLLGETYCTSSDPAFLLAGFIKKLFPLS
jgi:hypothetical protein